MTEERSTNAELQAIEQQLEGTRSELASAQAELASLQRAREDVKVQREQLERRVDLLREAVRRLDDLTHAFREEAERRIGSVESHRMALERRLQNAMAAVEAYWKLSPHARHCDDWLSWSPQLHRPITPADLRGRFSLSVAAMSAIITHSVLHDRRLRDRLMGHRQEYLAARGPVEKAAAIAKVRSSFAGEAGERIVRAALGPLAERVSSSVRKELSSGSYTKIDGTYEGLKVPVVLGRGEGMAARPNGSLATEVKWGRPEYIWTERNHMATQAEGHQHYDTSVTLCSRDFHDLQADKQQSLRDTLHAAQSPLLVVLPSKAELDQACVNVLMNFTPPELDVP